MSCYLRHLDHLFVETDLDPLNKQDRKKLDMAIRLSIGLVDTPCNKVWARIKQIGRENKDLVARVKQELAK